MRGRDEAWGRVCVSRAGVHRADVQLQQGQPTLGGIAAGSVQGTVEQLSTLPADVCYASTKRPAQCVSEQRLFLPYLFLQFFSGDRLWYRRLL